MSTDILAKTAPEFNTELFDVEPLSAHGDGCNCGCNGGSGGRLGTTTGIVYPTSGKRASDAVDVSAATVTIRGESSGVDTLSAAAMHRRNRYRLQRVAADVLGDDWRVANCMWRMHDGDYDGVAGGVTIQRTVTDEGCGRSYYGGLMTCGSTWTCPVCAMRIAAERAAELEAAIEAHTAAGGSVVMVTPTVQHRKADTLAALLDALKVAMRYQRSGAAHRRFVDRFGLVGHARSLEIRINVNTGWHPHLHELLFLSGDVDVNGIRDAYHARYGAKLREMGYHVNEHTVHVTDDRATIGQYLTKFALELTTGQDKDGRDPVSFSPFQLLDMHARTGQRWYADKFREYAEATKGRNWFTWSWVRLDDGQYVSFYNWLTGNVERPDEEISPEDDAGETEVLLTLTRSVAAVVSEGTPGVGAAGCRRGCRQIAAVVDSKRHHQPERRQCGVAGVTGSRIRATAHRASSSV